MTTAAGGRHAFPRRVARLSLARRMMTAALAAGAATVLAVVASGGTYALFNSAAGTAGGTLRAGTATLVLGETALSLPTTRLQPGTSINGTTTISNSGNVPLSLRVSGLTGPATATGFSSALTIGVSFVATTATCPAVSAAWTGTFATAAPADLGVRLGVGEAQRVCVSLTLPATAPGTSNTGGSIPFAISLDGRQVV